MMGMICHRHFLKLIPIIGLLAAALPGCAPSTKTTKKDVKVVVTTPIMDRVIEYQDFTGRMDAVKSVEIRARVSGYVTEVFFQEGDRVEEGKPLFQIDIGPYSADYNQAVADLKLAIADRNLMSKNAERAQRMWQSKAMAEEEYQTTMALLDKSVATVGSKTAARDKTKLYLDYTKVLAPVTGKISRRFVDPGNLITADTTVLTTIVSENPMYAYFDVDERTFLDLSGPDTKKQQANDWKGPLGLFFANRSAPDVLAAIAVTQSTRRPVMMALSNEKEFNRVGHVDFVDNRIGATTGTIRMRGIFQNPQGLLAAGLFVRIRLPVGEPYEAILIPDEAIQSDQERKYVWVINSKNEAEYRPIKLGQAIGELRVIQPASPGKMGKEGLSLDERVVISGVQRVSSGKAVEAKMQTPPERPGMPLVKLWETSQGR
jgi:RND family efflux transporter MFP subunit